MDSPQRLQLDWIDKQIRHRLEPRILLEDHALSIQAGGSNAIPSMRDNRLIVGDNLLVLRALEQEFAGRIRCIAIDPPYNTGSAFEQYDDGREHSVWLSMMRERLDVLRRLLTEDGSLWICIDDHEGHYLKVLCDEVFGRRNFVSTVIWQKKYAPKSDSKYLSNSHDFILVYAKNLERVRLNRLHKTEKQTVRYTNRDNDARGPWKAGDVLRNEVRDYAVFPVRLPSGREVMPPPGTSWRYTRDKFEELVADHRIWFGVNGDARPAIKRFLSEVTDSIPATTIWGYDEVGHNDEAKKESKVLFGDQLFATPKPERLMHRIVELATDPGDLVLDSFAGSGTTGAVAHKMGRRWIMVELHDDSCALIRTRLKKVIDGTDRGGVSAVLDWQGGGGFRFFRLASSLLQTDQWGNLIINREYNPEMLAEAVCKHMGFTYAPSEAVYWQHGHSTESDFIYVTTQTLTHEQLAHLSDEVGENRTLLVCCAAFRGKTDAFPNLTVKKIPTAVLHRCEWGRDDYSLNVVSLPAAPPGEPDAPPADSASANGGGKREARVAAAPSLALGMDGEA